MTDTVPEAPVVNEDNPVVGGVTPDPVPVIISKEPEQTDPAPPRSEELAIQAEAVADQKTPDPEPEPAPPSNPLFIPSAPEANMPGGVALHVPEEIPVEAVTIQPSDVIVEPGLPRKLSDF